MHVARLDADPVHGRQMAGRVAGLRVPDQLGLGSGARREVEQERVARQRHPVRRELLRAQRRVGVAVPAVGVAPDHDPGPRAGDAGELRRLGLLGHHVPHVAPRHPVFQVGRLQQRRRGDDDRAQLHRRQHHLPQRDDVAQHEQHPVAAPHPEPAQPGRDLRRPRRQAPVADRLVGPVVADHPQRDPVGMLGRDRVEPVEGPVELVQLRPAELGPGRVVVLAVVQQQVTGRAEGGEGGVVAHCPMIPAARRQAKPGFAVS